MVDLYTLAAIGKTIKSSLEVRLTLKVFDVMTTGGAIGVAVRK